jgi:hypothetical protein
MPRCLSLPRGGTGGYSPTAETPVDAAKSKFAAVANPPAFPDSAPPVITARRELPTCHSCRPRRYRHQTVGVQPPRFWPSWRARCTAAHPRGGRQGTQRAHKRAHRGRHTGGLTDECRVAGRSFRVSADPRLDRQPGTPKPNALPSSGRADARQSCGGGAGRATILTESVFAQV